MRLINVETLQMEEFFGDAIPKYAILSHTWGEEEVSFDDWHQPERAARMKGYAKIMGTCSFVSGITGLNYVWVDTACIDKRSSADLSEAINSMFHWYGSSQVCLVYLADVDAPDQWFTRGWTLQELLAPRHVLFLSRDWRLLGNVPWLVDDICEVTGIPDRFLTKDLKLSMASVAQRMSWAAGRQTTRVEDMAYCLLGLFNINMPLLYGEGPKAFWRLQAEIIKESYDHSIFSWQRDTDPERGITRRGAITHSPTAVSASHFQCSRQ
ncbi:heterokaryon incompatibility protein-domain-containing protein [Mariannaea sp. PMI_226]|nr:heterokaryon incompatibility protein-domain-containing protein [Mariannaea sp. PMI_226]